MGLFTPEKTTKDYLKEIAKSQKDLANVERGYLKAEKSAQRASIVGAIIDSLDRGSEQAASQKQIEKDRLRSKLDDIHAIEFDPADPAAIAQTLLKMVNQIDVWVKQAKKTKKYLLHLQAMETKLEQGLLILTSVDPANNMLPYFNKKQEEWQQIKEKQRKRNLIEWVIVIAIPVVSLIMCITTINGEELDASYLWIFGVLGGLLSIVSKASPATEDDND